MIRQTADHPDPLLTTKAGAARMLAISTRMVDLLVGRGALTRIRLTDRAVRFDVAEIRRLVESRRVQHGADDGQARDRQGRFQATG